MRIVRSSSGWLWGLFMATASLATVQVASAQTTKMPSTLRYGSGYMDVPVASVLPHLSVTGTFSGFNVNVEETGITPAVSSWFFDGSAALGLFRRLEIGTTLQSFNDADAGGNMLGAFGRLAILRPEREGIGLAGGVRYVTAPDFDDNVTYQPPRLGFPDRRFTGEGLDTELSFYGVASAFLRGLEANWLPEYDVTVTIGWGNGMFLEGKRFEYYRHADSRGWLVAGAAHVQVAENSLLNLMGEWNGFDVNIGAQLDLGGFRVGGHVLGANYWTDVGAYRSPKYGVLASACLDLSGESFLCKPALMARPEPVIVQLPAPPPDTVVVEREVTVAPPLPTGTAADICLATGNPVSVLVTAQGDTLVGPGRVSITTLRPGVVFAGTYAEGRDWFVSDQPVTFEQLQYLKSGGEVSLTCANIMQVGEFMGVPLFALRTAERPFPMLYVPVRAGVWQAYETGLPATRGVL